jgi:hypothetical protein
MVSRRLCAGMQGEPRCDLLEPAVILYNQDTVTLQEQF